ncbi:MAG: type II toxin-antitoxin system RelE/ParE family toxin [Methylococcaceae bacterium]|nr:type II toxin-antitoxin system RelE/ParE family toxin [Methylococcaceae bacterium]
MQDKAVRSLAKIDRIAAAKIWRFLELELPNMANPRLTGKALQGEFKGLWRYRVGDYRVICQIKDKELLILVIDTAHRKNIVTIQHPGHNSRSLSGVEANKPASTPLSLR